MKEKEKKRERWIFYIFHNSKYHNVWIWIWILNDYKNRINFDKFVNFDIDVINKFWYYYYQK